MAKTTQVSKPGTARGVCYTPRLASKPSSFRSHPISNCQEFLGYNASEEMSSTIPDIQCSSPGRTLADSQSFQVPEANWQLRREMSETALRRSRDLMHSFDTDRYYDFRQALLFHDRPTFLWWLQQDVHRLEYYWNSRYRREDPHTVMNNTNLARTFLSLSSMGFQLLRVLMRPDVHQNIVGEPIDQKATGMMLRAKFTYGEFHGKLMDHGIQFGSMDVAPPIYLHVRYSTATHDHDISALDDLEEEAQLQLHDSGVGIDNEERERLARAIRDVRVSRSRRSSTTVRLTPSTDALPAEEEISDMELDEIPVMTPDEFGISVRQEAEDGPIINDALDEPIVNHDSVDSLVALWGSDSAPWPEYTRQQLELDNSPIHTPVLEEHLHDGGDINIAFQEPEINDDDLLEINRAAEDALIVNGHFYEPNNEDVTLEEHMPENVSPFGEPSSIIDEQGTALEEPSILESQAATEDTHLQDTLLEERSMLDDQPPPPYTSQDEGESIDTNDEAAAIITVEEIASDPQETITDRDVILDSESELAQQVPQTRTALQMVMASGKAMRAALKSPRRSVRERRSRF